jgi:hypothetical protein
VVDLKFDGFDLTRYLAYLPVEKTFRLPPAFRPSGGCFEQPPAPPALNIKGGVSLEAVEVQHADGAPAIKLPSVKIGIDRLAPWPELAIASVSVDKPEIVVGRGRDGRISLLSLMPNGAAGRTHPAGACRRRPAKPFAVTLGEFKLTGGRVDFTDDLPAGVLRRRSRTSTFRCASLHWPAASRRRWISVSPPRPAKRSSTRAASRSHRSRRPALELAGGLDLPAPSYLAACSPRGKWCRASSTGRSATIFCRRRPAIPRSN